MTDSTKTGELHDAIFTQASKINTSFILRFNEFVNRALQNEDRQLAHLVETEGDQLLELKQTLSLVSGTFPNYLTTSTFLLLYANAEEWFELIRLTYAKEITKESQGTLSAFREVLKLKLNYDLKKSESWGVITDCERLRNCLVHANGRPDLSKNPDEVLRLIQRRPRLIRYSNKRVEVSHELLLLFVQAINEIINQVQGLGSKLYSTR